MGFGIFLTLDPGWKIQIRDLGYTSPLATLIPSMVHANHSDQNTKGFNPLQESGSAGRRCYLIKKLIKNLTLPVCRSALPSA